MGRAPYAFCYEIICQPRRPIFIRLVLGGGREKKESWTGDEDGTQQLNRR